MSRQSPYVDAVINEISKLNGKIEGFLADGDLADPDLIKENNGYVYKKVGFEAGKKLLLMLSLK